MTGGVFIVTQSVSSWKHLLKGIVMMKWLFRIGVVLVLLLAAFVVVGLLLPTDYVVERSVVVDAPRDRVHGLIADLVEWDKWEPWSAEDPTVVVTPGPKTTGVGASQTWTDQTGGGELVFTMSDPAKGVGYDMTIADAMHAKATILHEVLGDGKVRVTWRMEGDASGAPVVGGYLAKLLPAAIGPMFESGMANLKAIAETPGTTGVAGEGGGAATQPAE
ncbi:MAG: SRPBCC family protein [Planctomycetota bacterium]